MIGGREGERGRKGERAEGCMEGDTKGGNGEDITKRGRVW